MEKTMKARVQHKHDVEANWLKATNFTPLASEIIVYDSDENYDYPRIKIGDGKTNINGLPFIVDEDKITEIISSSLEDAKNSGEFDGTSASLSIKYARSAWSSKQPTEWQDSIPTLTPTEKYLWAQFTKIEGLSSSIWAGVIGAYGDKGETGKTAYQYARDGGYAGTEEEFAAKLAEANFSGSYNDLSDKPAIPSIAGLASTTYVDEAVKNKVDKDGNKVLSTNDYTTTEKNKLAGIAAGAEVNVNADWNATSGDAQILNKPTLGAMAAKNSVAKSDLVSEAQTSLGKADTALQPTDISDWAKQPNKPTYTASEVGARSADWMPTAQEVGALPSTTVIPTVPTKVSAFTNDAGYLTEHQDISGKLDASALPTAINTALAQAKASGEFDGKDAPQDAIRYNAQTLTEVQKEQARENIGAAEDIFVKDISAWQPVEYMNGVAWTEKGYYWTANGTHTSTQHTTNYASTTELIKIEPNCTYTLSAFAGVYFLYDSTGKNGVASDPNFNPTTPKTFETNANQYYIGLSYQTTDSTVWTPEKTSLIRTTISEVEYNALPTRADSLKSLYGKTVVCFGDSLFGMYRGDDSATAFVAAETGATVHNVGFGGCRMAVHPTSGYGAFSMWALAKAIAEKNWTTQDAQASSGSAYFPEQLALLKSIDFSKVDIVVIHYGTNDFASGNGIPIDNASDHDDYNSLCGALRYSIEKLLSAYPKLRIYISLPVYRYWTDNGTTTYAETYLNKINKLLPEFVEALRNTAAEYNLPVIDGYYGLGINKTNASTFLSDGTHHNATGRERFGRFIGQNLISQQTSGKSGMDTDAVNALISAAIGNAIGGSY